MLEKDSFTVSRDTLSQVYDLNFNFLEYHFINRNIHEEDYKDRFNRIFYNNLCEATNMIDLELIAFDC